MKAAPLLVAWHNDNTPIYSADFENHGKGRLATAGGDNNVRLWKIEGTGEDRSVSYLSTLVKHTQAVNVVRWCPRGELLASAGDDGTIILWVPSDNPSLHANFGEEGLEDKETWRSKTMCRSSGSEIYDLAWSPDGMFFITGSMDNITRIYNAHTGALARQVADHNHYVQGVAWDPLNEYIATQSSDRSVHVYTLKTKDGTPLLTKHNSVSKMEMPVRRVSHNSPAPPDFRGRASFVGDVPAHAHAIGSPATSAPGTPQSLALPMNPPATTHSRRSSFGSVSAQSMRRSVSPSPSMPLPAVMPAASPSVGTGGGIHNGTKTTALYANETFTSFFRRLTFSPDGSLLFTPAGQHKEQHHPTTEPSRTDDTANMTYIYTRAGLNKPPVAKLPGHKKPSLAIKCSPVYYTLRNYAAPTKEITIDTHNEDDIPALPEPAMAAKPTPSHSSMDPPPIAPSPAASGAAAPSPRSAADADGSGTPGPSTGPLPVFDLPYRLVYAVATQDAIHVYDTQQAKPLCVVSNLHYATFTDLTWSNDGLTLLITSSDGFCSCLTFVPGELGAVYHHPPQPKNLSSVTNIAGSPVASTPAQTPNYSALPPLARQPSSQGANPSPSPFTMAQPASPARSMSNASLFTQNSGAPAFGDCDVSQNDTPHMSAMPGLTATNSGTPTVGGVPLYTPPQTPGYTAAIPVATNTQTVLPPPVSSTIEKREGDAAESNGREKRRRIAPTLVSDANGAVPAAPAAAPQPPTSQVEEGPKETK
ncbi:hypothetical protein AAFC00_000521 [Neodothiora populina]|uniref:CAF1B/HIR1 beta-propeller domain-containing protein n=1 Tax=Neodothiora populina TaxID=2781224 RepID=A0ABR3PEB5_9PEZI